MKQSIKEGKENPKKEQKNSLILLCFYVNLAFLSKIFAQTTNPNSLPTRRKKP
jgi:hypothetical protein